jgi:LysR family transcriptional activator of nhaA
MEWLNYHHLRYFWFVVREGGLAQAGKVLRLSHPTISAQVHSLEDQLGQKLFTKVGRKLVLTEVGKTVYRYADEMFTLGREMMDTVQGRFVGQTLRLDVGVSDVVPKLIVRRLLQPALCLKEPVRLVCYEDGFDGLLAKLAVHSLDIVISDSPVPTGGNIRAFTHLLGEAGISFFGTPSMVPVYKRGFPKSLNGAPMLLPLENLALRRSLNQWFDRHGIRPNIVAEFEDSALLKVFGADGVGIFAASTVVEKEIIEQHGVRLLGRADGIREHFYAISIERHLKHPAIVAISDSARNTLFATKRAKTAGRNQTS